MTLREIMADIEELADIAQSDRLLNNLLKKELDKYLRELMTEEEFIQEVISLVFTWIGYKELKR